MQRRRRLAGFVTAMLCLQPGCTDTAIVERTTLEIGHHRLQLVVPEGWEHLDHGREQLFRLGENQVSLVDLGVATREGLVHDLRAAEALLHAGRRLDAVARVHEIGGPMFHNARRGQVARFWSPWTNVTYAGTPDDPFVLGAALTALIDGTEGFEEVTPERLFDHVLATKVDTRRHEIASQRARALHGSEWTEVETWDRVSHLSRSRLAYTEAGGYLLVLAIDRGPIETTAAAFEALLASIELEPPADVTQ